MTDYSEVAVTLAQGPARIVILGVGYVGLPLAIACVECGLKVVGCDIDETRLEALRSGRSVTRSISSEQLERSFRTGRFDLSPNGDCTAQADAILICVPTPLDAHREPDLSFIEQACATISKNLRQGQLVVLESSTFPGTTDEIVRPILEKSGLKAGIDFFLAYAPEREDPGNCTYAVGNTPRIVGADDPLSGHLAELLYLRIVNRVVRVQSSRIAEAAKMTENAFRSVNIAFVNELKVLYARMGIDIWEVIDAAKTKPFGYTPFYPGPGVGGHCIPIDPLYLAWKAKEFDVPTRLVDIASDINSTMPFHIVDMIADGLSRKYRMRLDEAYLLLLGIAYKRNVGDLRESPALKIWEILDSRGAHVEFYDPYISTLPDEPAHKCYANMKSIMCTREAIERFDGLVIVTDHDVFDYEQIACWAQLIFDARNATNKLPDELRQKVILV